MMGVGGDFMKPSPVKNKNGEITSYRFRTFIGRDEFGKQVFETMTWKPDKKYTEKQLEKNLVKYN